MQQIGQHRQKVVDVAQLSAYINYCGLDLVQLHGDEPPDFFRKLMPHTIKAVRIKDESSLEMCSAYQENLTKHSGGPRIYIKREDLNQTGAHKINNVMGQGLLVKRMGKGRVIAETGAGQHGVATATMAANMDDTHYVLGTACGAHPFPEIVSYFQSIIGREARRQIMQTEGRLPARVYACVGGGSNALGIFSGFYNDPTELVGVEAGGAGLETGRHASRLASKDGTPGIAQGYKTYFLQISEGQMQDTHSVAAGLDYVGVSPILAALWEEGRIWFEAAADREVLETFSLTMQKEGLIPALESAHWR